MNISLRRGRTFRVLACPLVALTSLALPACSPRSSSSTGKSEAQAVPVTVAPVAVIDLPRTVPVVGTLNAFEDVLLAPKVDGRVQMTLRDVGDAVVPGDILLKLESIDYRLAVEQARPALRAELEKLKFEAVPDADPGFWALVGIAFRLLQADPVAQARANLELSRVELERAELERSRGVGSQQMLDAAQTKVKVAEAAVQQAQTDARVTLAHMRRLQAALDEAEHRLEETELRAPPHPQWSAWSAVLGAAANPLRYSVAARMVSSGEMIRQMPVTNAYRLVLDHVLKLRVTVPEKYKPEVRVGQSVDVRVEAYTGRKFVGRVARINPTVDATNRTFFVEIHVPNFSRILSTGGFATAEILTRTDAGILTVPPEAVTSFAGVTKVFIVDGDRAKAIEVELGTREKEWVEIRGALPRNAKVVTSGQSQLVDGALIRIR